MIKISKKETGQIRIKIFVQFLYTLILRLASRIRKTFRPSADISV